MSKVTSKLQVTLPKSLAEQVHIRPGDEIRWEIAGEVLRITPIKKRAKSHSNPEDRLRWFDQATRRQRQREKKSGRATIASNVANRGWRREDLYDRGGRKSD
jgi:AbrB family looped-hinge helix DNA binding protein